MLGKIGSDTDDVVEWLRSVVQLILQVSYLRGKFLEHVLHVGILLNCLG